MGNRIQFQEKLSGILELAESKNKRITMEETEQYFAEDRLTPEQMTLVYDYLLSQKVVVKGYEKKGGTVTDKETGDKPQFTSEEQSYLKEYKSELAGIAAEKEGERESLLRGVLAGDALSKGRLTELYLPAVIEIAEGMHTEGVFVGDLVQEGNVSLMLAMDTVLNADEADGQIQEEVKAGIQAFIEEQRELKTQDKKMVEQVNRLDEGIRSLTEELGRKVSVDELAVFLDMDEAEIADVLKLAGEEIKEDE